MATIIELERQIRALKAEGHESNDAYVRVRPAIHDLQRQIIELERQGQR